MATPTILLVDDTEFFLNVQKEFLKESEATILTATNGEEALEVVRKHRPDIIFMDFHMPRMSGATCCTLLKSDPALRDIPVILITMAGKPAEDEACRNAGCDHILSKPLDRKQFLNTGHRFLPSINRRQKRIPCDSLVVCQAHGENFYGDCVDLSTVGIFVSSTFPVEGGEPLNLYFVLPGNNRDLVRTQGVVSWVNHGKHRIKPAMPEGFGVEFTNLPTPALLLIKAFIVQQTEAEAARPPASPR